MAQTIKQTEATPNHPADAAIWARIEAHIAFRYVARSVVWIVEGAGEWEPPLAPATLTLCEAWNGTAWETATPPANAAGGYVLPGEGPYRVTATVGAGTPPPAIVEAVARLKAYSAEIGNHGLLHGYAGVTRQSAQVGNPINVSIARPANWAANALVQSGAADLLRPYRRT